MGTSNVRRGNMTGYFEDFAAGDEFEHWPGKTITEAENHLFCLLTLANSPIHTDAVFAAKTLPGGRNLVVGTYVYSLLLGMSVPDISSRAVAALGVQDLRHVAPVYPGDTLYARTRVTEVRLSKSRPDCGVMTVETVGVNQDDAQVAIFTRAILLPRRTLS
jgi:acyl dehydratase